MNVDRMRRHMERDRERREAQAALRAWQARRAAMTPEHRAAHDRGVPFCQTCLNEDMARAVAAIQRLPRWSKKGES